LSTPFVGVDLAWGTKSRTGLCAARSGVVLDSATLHTDAEIIEWLRPWTDGPCVVGIDAPLIVPNQTGRRACEGMITKTFGPNHAGAHSSNASMPAFRPEPRGASLAKALDLSLDPALPEPRGAIETYPHPALVALFRLEKTLKYKKKHPKGVRVQAMGVLLECLESLAGEEPRLDVNSAPRWAAIVAAVDRGLLGKVEDELDAYLCAYIAMNHALRPERSHVWGDMATGYIVTPVGILA